MRIQKRKSTASHWLTRGALIGLTLVLCLPLLTQAQTYTEPEGPPFNPPNRTPGLGNDVALEFLNGTAGEQRKLGTLVIGERNGRVAKCTSVDSTGCSKLCLNPDPASGTNDPNCIRDWSDAAPFVGGPFLRLLGSAQLAQVDLGFSATQGYGYNRQYISAIIEANPTVNGSVGLRGQSSSTAHYAGYFPGRVVVQTESGTTQLCLNGTCINSWSEASGIPADSVRIQTTRYLSRQDGNVGLNGAVMANSIVLGAPLAGTSTTLTCGDGICSVENGELSSNCSADCL